MSHSPLISVIVPVYNASPYLAQCIENLMLQTYRNLEIIIIDDGSVDGSADVALKFPVKLIRQENKGVSIARNRGIEEASGDFIHFMDADDFINSEFYAEMLNASLSYEADVVCCSVIQEWLPMQSLVFKYTLIASNVEDKMSLTDVGNLGYCWKYLFRTSFIKNHCFKFDINTEISEDIIFSIPAVYHANRIVTVPKAVYIYKKRRDSATGKITKLSKEKKRRMFSNAQDFKRKFATSHKLDTLGLPESHWQRYRILGIPFFKKRTLNTGSVKWYLFGICVFQRKDCE